MFEKYGLFIALFILALCVNSNIITESRILGILIDFISFTVMVSCVFLCLENQNQTIRIKLKPILCKIVSKEAYMNKGDVRMKKKKARKRDGLLLDLLPEAAGELLPLLFRCLHKLFI
ncbi:hypothetical protein AAHT66_12200 [Bacillus inaquosorum]|uniref:hypothetical protein n=1 Tax=Bacillus sp. 0209A TaxID=3120562 RepID=UPI002FD91D55